MKKTVFSLIFFLSILKVFSSEIEIKLEFLKDDQKSQNTSTAHGDKLIQYNNHKLLDVVSWVTEIPIQYFQLKGITINPSINFKATSLEKIQNDVLKEEFIRILGSKFNIHLSFFKNERQVKVAFNSNKSKMKKCLNTIEVNKMILINRTWKGTCVSTENFIDQIEKWYNEKIVNELDQIGKYDFEMHKANSFEELVEELQLFYGITIEEDKRQIETLLIDFK